MQGVFVLASIDARRKNSEVKMHKRLKLVFLIGLLSLACSLTASPAAVISASQPPPQPSQAAPPTTHQNTPKHPASPTPAGVACVVTAQALNVRTCPGQACAVIGWLATGDGVTVASQADGWAELSGGQGWVNAGFLTCEDGAK